MVEAIGEIDGPPFENILAWIFRNSFVSPLASLLSIQQTEMETIQRRPLRLSLFSLLVIALNLILPSQALYFYLDGASASPKCFYEELPKDTLVSGRHASFPQVLY